jgi:methionyl-tRNA formyltransferase
LKVLFYGTPEFALPTLEALLERHAVAAVVTQPDKPAGRGRHLQAPPVKERALAAGIPVLQPPRLRDPGWPERLAEVGADVAVVVAFGQILPKAVLDVPRGGSINVHASILPRYRGAAPIAWAIIRGETESGITIFQMDPGMDTGDVLLSEATPIGAGETAGELSVRLSSIGARLMIRTLEQLDSLEPRPQDHAQATSAPRLKKEDGWLHLAEPARELVNRVRGCNPWPGAAVMTPAGRLLIWRAAAVPHPSDAAPGTLVDPPSPLPSPQRGEGDLEGKGEGRENPLSQRGRGQGEGALCIATGQGLLLPVEVQPENRKAMAWEDFLHGARLRPGSRVTAIAP